MTLGGWQRLWVLVSALYLIIVAVVAWTEFPRRDDIDHDSTIYAAMDAAHVGYLRPEPASHLRPSVTAALYDRIEASRIQAPVRIGRGKGITLPNGHTRYFADDTTEDLIWQTAGEYLAVVDSRLPPLRRRFVLLSTMAWLVPCLGLYVLGSSVGWVYRGFRSPTSTRR